MKPVEEKELKFSKMNLSQSPQTLHFSMAVIQQANTLTKYTTFRGRFYKWPVKTSAKSFSNQGKNKSKIVNKDVYSRLTQWSKLNVTLA